MERGRRTYGLRLLPATTLGAILAALAAFVTGATVGATHTEALVTAAAAAGAWAGFLFGGRDHGEILILRLLLAANLFVFAFGTHETVAVEAGVGAFAAVFTLGALQAHYRSRR